MEYRVYLAEVLHFADTVERYYKACSPKHLPENPYERDGYTAFWNEWHRRYREGAKALAIHERLHQVFLDFGYRTVLIGGRTNYEITGQYHRITHWNKRCCVIMETADSLADAEAGRYEDSELLDLTEDAPEKLACLLRRCCLPGAKEDSLREWFRVYVQKGHGSAYLRLRNRPPAEEEKKEYADVLIGAMCRDSRYDRQGNADRTMFLLDLYDLFDAQEKERILRMVLDRHMQIGYEDICAYAHLLKSFAGRGIHEAGEILQKLYTRYRTALDSRTECPAGIDELAGMVDILEYELDIRPPVRRQCAPETRPPEPPMTMETLIGTAEDPKGLFHPARYRAFLKKQPRSEIAKLAEAVRAETDPETKARLYSLFDSVEFPGDPAEMISLLRQRTEYLGSWVETDDPMEKQRRLTAWKLVHALAGVPHPAVRELGLELAEKAAENENLRVDALMLWCSHFDETTDTERLLDFLEKAHLWEKDRDTHDIDYVILHRLYGRQYEDIRMYGFLTDIFMRTYCPACRHTAVKILAEHGKLQERVRQMCLWDCEPETRKLAAEMEGKTI